MNKSDKKIVSFSNLKLIIIVVSAIAILIISQTLSSLIANLAVIVGLPNLIGNIILGIAYPLITLLCVSVLVKKMLNLTLEDFKISKPRIKSKWFAVALAMPLIVSVILLFTKGHWENTAMSSGEIGSVLTGAVFYYGFATGIVEEVIFRGVIMSALEYRWNKWVAIIIPSVIFGAVHIFGNELDFLSTIQLLIAGSIVGILFSLVTYESKGIWCSALIHGLWNTIIVGHILNIGTKADETAIFNYVLDTNLFIITGGDFGIESSIVSIIVYLLVIAFALFFLAE